jgi:hypothetical protein
MHLSLDAVMKVEMDVDGRSGGSTPPKGKAVKKQGKQSLKKGGHHGKC